jgi:hypothetical protein
MVVTSFDESLIMARFQNLRTSYEGVAKGVLKVR